MISLVINGQPHQFANNVSIAQLIAELGLTGKRVAVDRNGEIVPKSLHADLHVSDGDQLEIVVAVGGG